MERRAYRFFVGGVFIMIVFYFGAVNVPTAVGSSQGQTVPTRTNTPLPTPTDSGGGGSNPTTTNTPVQATATSTLLPVTFAPTPIGGFIETAVPCSGNPTIQTRGATNVRSGPGIAYDEIGELVFLEVRYIVGRAETVEWWLIQFNNGQTGWVADAVVEVQGYTAIVPIVEAPPLNDSTPTPGTPWNPTPNPSCTVTPIPADTASPSATVESTPTTPAETPSPTEPAPTEVRPTDTPIVQPTAVPRSPTPVSTAVPEQVDEGSSGSILLLVVLGLLIGIGLIIFFLRRR